MSIANAKRFADQSEAKAFHAACRIAVRDDKSLQATYADWKKQHHRRTYDIKTSGDKVTSASKRAEIMDTEATAYAKLLDALPTAADTNFRVRDVQNRVSDVQKTGEATNAIVGRLEAKLDTMMELQVAQNAVIIDGELPDRAPGQTAVARQSAVYGHIRRLQSEGKNLKAPAAAERAQNYETEVDRLKYAREELKRQKAVTKAAAVEAKAAAKAATAAEKVKKAAENATAKEAKATAA